MWERATQGSGELAQDLHVLSEGGVIEGIGPAAGDSRSS